MPLNMSMACNNPYRTNLLSVLWQFIKIEDGIPLLLCDMTLLTAIRTASTSALVTLRSLKSQKLSMSGLLARVHNQNSKSQPYTDNVRFRAVTIQIMTHRQ